MIDFVQCRMRYKQCYHLAGGARILFKVIFFKVFIKLNLLTLMLLSVTQYKMSLVVRKPDFCICENKDADQLRGYREADQRLCFRYTDSTITLLP